MFSLLINLAIWLRAGMAVAQRLVTQAAPVLLDAALIFGGMYFLKTYWEHNHKYVRVPYPPQFMLVAVPVYIVVWLTTAYFSGAYDKPVRTSRIVRGILLGTLFISAASNFFDAWRFSKALIVLGGAWAVAALLLRRTLAHLVRYRNLGLLPPKPKHIAIVGSAAESGRVRHLLESAAVSAQVVGYVRPDSALPASASARTEDLLGEVRQLEDIVRIYGVDELIFCGKDVPASQIMALMVQLPQQLRVAYKILPEDSEYIIGSSSKDSPGDFYTLDIALNLFQPQARRNKRLLDVVSSLVLLLTAPLGVFLVEHKAGFVRNCLRVLVGQRTWVGLRYTPGPQRMARAILSPADAVDTATPLAEATRRRLELLYARDYETGTDLRLLLRRFRGLGQE